MSRPRIADLRRQRGFSQEMLAERLGVAANTVAGWERGRSDPLARHRRPLAELLEVSTEELTIILDGGHDDDEPVAPWLGLFTAVEQTAVEIWSFEATVVPGLLQTRAYAEAVESSMPNRSLRDIDRLVEERLARQHVITRERQPMLFRVVIDESVLQRQLGSEEVMAEQLAHLRAMDARLNVEVRLAPSDVNLLIFAPATFHLITPASADGPLIACSEGFEALHWHERSEQVARLRDIFEHVLARAVPVNGSSDELDQE